MNHSLCCAYDITTPPLLSTRPIAATSFASHPLICASIIFASPSTVGSSTIFLSPTSTPITSLTLLTTCVAISECPPISKKFSLIPTPSTPSTSSHIPLSISSTALLDLTPSSAFLPLLLVSLTSGSPLTPTFPSSVSGILLPLTYSLGITSSATRSLRCLLISSAPISLLDT